MTWGMVAVAGATVVGGVVASSSAKSAANAQTDAANSANALSQSQYNQTRQDNLPFLNNGTAASNQLAYRLGLSASPTSYSNYNTTSNPDQSEANFNSSAYLAANPDVANPTNWAGTAYQHYQQYGQNEGRAFTYNTSPTDATTQQNTAQQDPNYGSLTRNFNTTDLTNDPIYQAALAQGMQSGTQGINNLAAANGSLNSGATLKALTRFGQSESATLGNDAYNRYNTNNTNTYNRLAGVSGSGQTASNTVGAAGATNTNALSNTAIGLGNSRGASAISQGNSISNGVNSISNYYQQQQMLNQLNNNGTNYNGYMNNANVNGFGTAFGQNGFSSNPAYG